MTWVCVTCNGTRYTMDYRCEKCGNRMVYKSTHKTPGKARKDGRDSRGKQTKQEITMEDNIAIRAKTVVKLKTEMSNIDLTVPAGPFMPFFNQIARYALVNSGPDAVRAEIESLIEQYNKAKG